MFINIKKKFFIKDISLIIKNVQFMDIYLL